MALFGKRRDRDGDTQADGAPRTLLDEMSPYGSRRVLVATNGTETWAQLFDGAGQQVTALWLAAHRGPAPDIQLSVPPEATRNPGGRPPFGHVEAVWFEEGDGVALFDNEGMLAVLPGWAGPDTLPGHSREAVAPSLSAAPLHGAVEQFGPRAERARGYWTWRNRPEAWQEYQTELQGHLTARLGAPQHVWPLGEGEPAVVAGRYGGETEHLAVTVGMSAQRMPAVEQFVDDPGRYARIELAVAGLGKDDADLVLLRWLARHPWRSATWIGSRHTVRWPGQSFPVGAPFAGVVLVDDPTHLPGPAAPDLSGHTVFGDPVRFLWLVPVTDEELRTARSEGGEALLARLRAAGRSWVAGDAGQPASAQTRTGDEDVTAAEPTDAGGPAEPVDQAGDDGAAPQDDDREPAGDLDASADAAEPAGDQDDPADAADAAADVDRADEETSRTSGDTPGSA